MSEEKKAPEDEGDSFEIDEDRISPLVFGEDGEVLEGDELTDEDKTSVEEAVKAAMEATPKKRALSKFSKE